MTLYDDWSAQLQPWWTDDLLDYVGAIASMWDQVEPFIDDDPDNDIVAWQMLFDVDIAPLSALPWLAQCVGERIPVGLDEASARAWIRNSPDWSRGTPQGIANSVKRLLTGTQMVQMRERFKLDGTSDPDWLAVLTYAVETPSQQRVLNALRRNVPADIVIDYQCATGPTWASLEAGQASWTSFETTYGPNWSAVAGARPNYNIY